MINKLAKKLLLEKSYYTGGYLMPPEFLSLIVTFRCNFRCLSCSIWQKQSFTDELSDEEWLAAAEELKRVLPVKTFVELNGGEPLIKKSLVLKLVANLKKHFSTVTLNSNGLLIDQNVIKDLEAVGLDAIKISFYSLDQGTHNSLRGDDKAFTSADRAIRLLSKSKIRLEVGVLVTAKNIKQLPELVTYLQSLPNTSIIIQSLDESVESAESKALDQQSLNTTLWPETKDVEAFFSWLAKNHHGIKNSLTNLAAIKHYYLKPASTLSYRCFAGQRNLVVYPNGDLTFCFKQGSFGNIKKDDLKTALRRAKTARQKTKSCQKYCRIIGCNFSRGIKELLIRN